MKMKDGIWPIYHPRSTMLCVFLCLEVHGRCSGESGGKAKEGARCHAWRGHAPPNEDSCDSVDHCGMETRSSIVQIWLLTKVDNIYFLNF